MKIRLDISAVPFSRYGAYLSLTADKEGKLTINTARRRFEESRAFELLLFKGGEEITEYTLDAAPEGVIISANGGGFVTVYIADDDTMAFVSEGVDLYFHGLDKNSYGTEQGKRGFTIVNAGRNWYSSFYVPEGKIVPAEPWDKAAHYGRPTTRKSDVRLDCVNGWLTASLNISNSESKPKPLNPEKSIAAVKEEWETFLKKMPAVSAKTDAEKEFAAITWFNLWSSFVRARDVYKRDTMLMSKNYMTSVWSWDHCFNALAMGAVSKEAALDQFMAPFWLQEKSGAIPDMWNPVSGGAWGVVKPPVHGWCFSRLMDRFEYPEATLKRVYKHLSLWTGWWLNFRDGDRDGLPSYPQGCDSGWDTRPCSTRACL